MLRELLRRKGLEHVRHLETTVGPDNQASRRSFAGLAAELGAHVSEQPFFDRQLFGGADHDDEMLLRIGPVHLARPVGGWGGRPAITGMVLTVRPPRGVAGREQAVCQLMI